MAKKTVANLNIKIGADHASLRKDFDRAGMHTKRFGSNAKTSLGKLGDLFGKARSGLSGVTAAAGPAGIALAAAGAAAFAGWKAFNSLLDGIGDQLEKIDSLAKTSSKLGIEIDDLSALRLAGERSGLAINTVDMALQRFTRRLSEAAAGSGEAKDALKELEDNFGLLGADELSKLGTARALEQVAEAFSRIDDSGTRLRLAFKLFDSEGAGFVNVFKGGSDVIRQATKDIDELGLSISGLDAANIEQMNDNLASISLAIEGITRTLTAALGEAFAEFSGEGVDLAKEAVAEFRKWVPAIKETTVAMLELFEAIKPGLMFTLETVRNIVTGLNAIAKLNPAGNIAATTRAITGAAPRLPTPGEGTVGSRFREAFKETEKDTKEQLKSDKAREATQKKMEGDMATTAERLTRMATQGIQIRGLTVVRI